MALVGLFFGVKMPTLTWTGEIMPIKQGGPVMITLFGGFGYIVLLFVGFMLLSGWMLGAGMRAVLQGKICCYPCLSACG